MDLIKGLATMGIISAVSSSNLFAVNEGVSFGSWTYDSSSSVYSTQASFDSGTTADVSLSPLISVSNQLASTPSSAAVDLSVLATSPNSYLSSVSGLPTDALLFKTNGSEIDSWELSFSNFSAPELIRLVLTDVDGEVRDDGNELLSEQWIIDSAFRYEGSVDTTPNGGTSANGTVLPAGDLLPVWDQATNTLTGEPGAYSGGYSVFQSDAAVTEFTLTVTDLDFGSSQWTGRSTRGATVSIFTIPEPSSSLFLLLGSVLPLLRRSRR